MINQRGPFIYDGYDLLQILFLEDVRSFLMPTIENTTSDGKPSRGDIYVSSRFATSTIETDVRLISLEPNIKKRELELASLKRQAAYRLFRTEEKMLMTPDNPGISYLAKLDGSTQMNRINNTKAITLNWAIYNPVGYGKHQRRELKNGGSERVLIDGTYKTAPVVKVQARGPFQILFDDQIFNVTDTFAGEVTVDCVTHKATKVVNGKVEYVEASPYSEFASWEPGRHEIGCLYPFTFEWDERWL